MKLPFITGFAITLIVLMECSAFPELARTVMCIFFLCAVALVILQAILDRRSARKAAQKRLRYLHVPSTAKGVQQQ